MPALAEGLVDVWRADLSRERTSHLPPGESLGAERFVFQADRQRWIRSRSILRMLLGSYLGADPLGLSFSVSEAGKPVVAGISFSLSHSGDMALYAFTSGA